MNRNVLKTLNLVGFVGTVLVNALANALPIAGRATGELSDQYPNLFVPAGLTFSVWGLIYLLLLAFTVYQIAGKHREWVHERIGLLFFFASAANVGWIFAWHHELIALSVLIMLALFGLLLAVYLRLGNGRADSGGLTDAAGRICVHVSFSVYLGWITVATIANITALLVDLGWGGFGLSEAFWTVLMIGAAAVITAVMLVDRRDVFFAAVIVWALAGIALKRAQLGYDAPAVFAAAVAAGGLLLLGVLFVAARSLRDRTSP